MNKSNNLNPTRNIFEAALKNLQSGLMNLSNEVNLFRHQDLEQIFNLSVVNEEPLNNGIYDISLFEQKVYFSQKLMNCYESYWETNYISDDEKQIMCWLYYLHEFKHIEQRVDSNTYRFSQKSASIFQTLDYVSDAFAVKGCFLLQQPRPQDWKYVLVQILKTHIQGGEVFRGLDNSEQKTISGERLHRQMIWHLQYARARAFNPNSNFERYGIDKRLVLEIFSISDEKENLCTKLNVSESDLSKILEIHILVEDERYRYNLTPQDLRDSLVKAILKNDLDSSYQTFRAFFADNQNFIGFTQREDLNPDSENDGVLSSSESQTSKNKASIRFGNINFGQSSSQNVVINQTPEKIKNIFKSKKDPQQ